MDSMITGEFTKPVDDQCRTKARWYGYSSGEKVGEISATLKGSGEVSLEFGNCWIKGVVRVTLNGELKAEATANTPNTTLSFGFEDGDVLRISEDIGVVVVNDIRFDCSVEQGKWVILYKVRSLGVQSVAGIECALF